MNPIEQNAIRLLELMVEANEGSFTNTWLQNYSKLTPRDISDAVNYLEDVGAIKVIKTLGTAPFRFASVWMESRGRYLYHEIKEHAKKKVNSKQPNGMLLSRPINPIGSPYGFTEDDWLTVSLQKEKAQTLYVVLGMQFQSTHYNTDDLSRNVKTLFENAVSQYNHAFPDNTITLHFEQLAAGLGEHLFNQIARSIIGADIAVFETSDLNPNVMLEMGVALTWGVRVIPMRKKGGHTPPSDISGQTWIEHEDSASAIADSEFQRKLFKMIERVVVSKGRGRVS